MNRIAALFSLQGRVERRQYIAAGVGLALVKYSVDAGSFFAVTGEFWDPLVYMDPTLAQRLRGVDHLPAPYLIGLLLWTLPFLWIGVALSSRRARDAGLSPWLALLFLVPFAHYLLIASLALVRSSKKEPRRMPRDDFSQTFTLLAMGACIILPTALIGLLADKFWYYGVGIFLGLPFVMGTVVGFLYNLRKEQTVSATSGAVLASILLGFAALGAVALEGALCLAMAYPIMGIAGILGGIFGRALALMSVPVDASLGLVLIALPCGSLLDQRVVAPGEREVVTSIEIDASPEIVWAHVVSFSELPAPTTWLFRTGIAYPLRARIEGEGVGAVRYCEFSTGPFVEPITVWDEPRRLAFDVVEQPVPMKEWSFYAQVHAPHLEESFRSVRGEFRLVPTAAGGTRLEGSTWYVMEMGPAAYWKVWGDAILHRIHLRVLEHVRDLSEASSRSL